MPLNRPQYLGESPFENGGAWGIEAYVVCDIIYLQVDFNSFIKKWWILLFWTWFLTVLRGIFNLGFMKQSFD